MDDTELAEVGDLPAEAARVIRQKAFIVEVVAGQVLNVETSPSGEEVCIRTCPSGKVRKYTVTVEEWETDA